MIEAEWWEYDSLDELADAVAGDVGFIIDSAVEARNASLIAVPGGMTGPAVFPKLTSQKLPWKKVVVIPTDDRLVPVEQSRMLNEKLKDVGVPVKYVEFKGADHGWTGDNNRISTRTTLEFFAEHLKK